MRPSRHAGGPSRRFPVWARATLPFPAFLVLPLALMLLSFWVILEAPEAGAISLRAAAGADNGGGATTLVIAKPTGVLPNDVMVAQVTVRGGTAASITAPSGWVLIDSQDAGTTIKQGIYYRVADATEGLTYAWTFDATRKASGGIIAYSGVDNANPVDASGGQTTTGSASVTAPSITTTQANDVLVGFFGIGSASTFTPPSGMTERYDDQSNGGSRTSSEGADESLAAPGATGTRVASATSSGNNVGHLVALRPPTVAFSSASSSGSESTLAVTIPVTLSGASSAITTVDYAVTGGTAAGGVDYTLASGTLTFAAGVTSQNIALVVVDDLLDEDDETIEITLSSATNANLGSTTFHTYTINDNDAAPTVTLDLSGSPMAEAAGSATVTATLSAASGKTVTVNLAFSGTATLTTDYTRSGTSIGIAPGATTGSITLTAVQDAEDEPGETIVVDVDSVTNGAESGTQQVTATIADDDVPTVTVSATDGAAGESGPNTGTFTFTRSSGDTSTSLTVYYTVSGTATNGTDYTALSGSVAIPTSATSATVTVTPIDDSTSESAETVVVTINSNAAYAVGSPSAATVTISDDDPPVVSVTGTDTAASEPGTNGGTFTFSRTGDTGSSLTVLYSVSGTATSGADYTALSGSVVIPSSSASADLTLTPLDDALDEDDETVIVTLTADAAYTIGAPSGATVTIADDDAAPTVTLSVTGSPLAEAGGSATVTATLSAASGRTVTADLAFSGTATVTTDYTRSGTSITIGPGSTTGSVTLTAVQDALDEDDETIIVDVVAVTNGAESGTQQVTATIADDDAAPSVTLSLSGSPAGEAGGVATVTATLSAVSGRTVTIDLAFSGTATLTSDYTRSGTSITIGAGGTTGTVSLTAVQDALDEDDETILVEVSSVTNGLESGDQAVTASISDDDAPPSVSLSLSGSPAAEAAGVATVTAALSAVSGRDVLVTLAFSGTATLANDYTRSATSITITAGSSAGSITLTAVQDALDEDNETIIVDIDAVTNGAESGAQQVTATISDDDASPTVSLALSGSPLAEAAGSATVTATLSAVSGRTVTVDLAFAGTATLTSDYTRSDASIAITAGGTSGTISLTAVQDALDEDDETVTVDIASVTNGAEAGTQQVTATITDDDEPPTVTLTLSGNPMAEAGGSATVTAALSAVSGRDVTVGLDFSGSATLTSDYTRSGASITINAGSASSSITLTAVQDTRDEDNETIVVAIDAVTNGAEAGTQEVTATITDDDAAPSVSLSLSGSPLAEAAGAATVTATLGAVSGKTVTVGLAFSGTATLSDDYTRSGATIIIAAGSASGSVTLTAVQDTLFEEDESIVVDVSSVTNGTESGTQQATATITDDDAAPTVTLSLSGSPTAEASGSATVTATLSAASGLETLVNLSFSGTATATSDYTRSAASISIAAGLTMGSITLTAVQDALDEDDETIIVDVSTVANAIEVGTQRVTATVTDDDAPPTVTLSIAGTPVAEAAGSATVTATLSAASGKPVTVNLSFAGTATLTTDYTRSGTTIAIGAGSTTGSVTLTAVQDTLDEDDETVIVDISSVTNGTETGTQAVTASIADDDAPPAVALELAGSPLAEAAGVATVTATLSAASGRPVSVDLEFAGTATLTADYTRSGTSITIDAGLTTGSLSLTAVQDTLDEDNETIIVAVSSATNATESGTQQVTATIADDDEAPTVTLSLSGSPLAEAAGVATVTATLSAASGKAVTVTLDFSGTAALTSDYTRSGLGVTIGAGATTGSVTLTAVQDEVDEDDETIVVDIGSVTNGTESGAQQVTATIADDDATPSVTLSITGSSMAEAEGVATVTATLSAVSGRDVTVDLAFSGTATLSTDYTPSGASLTISAGSTAGSITLTAVQDAVNEADETVVVDIDAVSNALESGTQQVTATIADDEGAPGVTLGLSGSPIAEAGGSATVTATLNATTSRAVVVTLDFSGTAALAGDYTRSAPSITIGAGSTTGSITVTAVQDALDEASETIVVDIASVTNGTEIDTQQVTVVIADDDPTPSVTLAIAGAVMDEAGGVAVVYANLSAVSGRDVTVTLAFTGSATLTSDYTSSASSIAIAAGSAGGTITLTAVDDAVPESDETIAVDIGSVTHGTEAGAQQVTATIVDDDEGQPVSIAATDASASETGPESGSFTVTRSGEAALALSVNYAVSGTATSGSDYVALAGSVTIEAGSASATVVLTPVDDAVAESAETVIVTLVADAAYAIASPDSATITIIDNDAAGITVIPTSGLATTEAAGTANFTVVLNTQPTADVVVGIASGDATEGTASPSSLTFTSANWNTPRTVTVTGVDDAVADGDIAYSIVTAAAVSLDPSYAGLDPSDVSATNTDDEGDAGFTVSITGGSTSVAENGTTDTFTVLLDVQPAANVTLSVASGDAGRVSVSPAFLAFNASTWNVAQTVTVRGVDNLRSDASPTVDATVAVVVGNSSAEYATVASQTVSVSAADDDAAGVTWQSTTSGATAGTPLVFTPGDTGSGSAASLSLLTLATLADHSSNLTLRVELLSVLPSGVPDLPSGTVVAQLLNLSYADTGGAAVALDNGTVRFFVAESWITSTCPGASCSVRLFHHDGSSWVALATTKVSTNSTGRTYEAHASSFSPYAIGGVPVSSGGGGGGGGGGVSPTPAPPPLETPPARTEEPPVPEPPVGPAPVNPEPVIGPVVEPRTNFDWAFVAVALLVTAGTGIALSHGGAQAGLRAARSAGVGAWRGARLSTVAIGRSSRQAWRTLHVSWGATAKQVPLASMARPMPVAVRDEALRLDHMFHALHQAGRVDGAGSPELRDRVLADARVLNRIFRSVRERARGPTAGVPEPLPSGTDEALVLVAPLHDVEQATLTQARAASRVLAGAHRARLAPQPVRSQRQALAQVSALNHLLRGLRAAQTGPGAELPSPRAVVIVAGPTPRRRARRVDPSAALANVWLRLGTSKPPRGTREQEPAMEEGPPRSARFKKKRELGAPRARNGGSSAAKSRPLGSPTGFTASMRSKPQPPPPSARATRTLPGFSLLVVPAPTQRSVRRSRPDPAPTRKRAPPRLSPHPPLPVPPHPPGPRPHQATTPLSRRPPQPAAKPSPTRGGPPAPGSSATRRPPPSLAQSPPAPPRRPPSPTPWSPSSGRISKPSSITAGPTSPSRGVAHARPKPPTVRRSRPAPPAKPATRQTPTTQRAPAAASRRKIAHDQRVAPPADAQRIEAVVRDQWFNVEVRIPRGQGSVDVRSASRPRARPRPPGRGARRKPVKE